MSVGQTRRAPDQPDYDAEDVLTSLRNRYNLTDGSEWVEEFGMSASEAFSFVENELTRDERDKERLKHQMGIDAMLEHEYEDSHWTNEEEEEYMEDVEKKEVRYDMLEDPQEDDAWILKREVEYKD